MSAGTVESLDVLRDHALTIGTPTQQRFRAWTYAEARRVTPGLLVWWHDVTGLARGRVTRLQQRRLARVAEEVRRG